MSNIHGSDLREIIRIFVRNLGLLERTEACCCSVTLAQCHAIIEIGRATEITLNTLADILTLDKSTMSRTIDNLVNQGLVFRETHPENRRYLRIILTESGKEVYEKIELSMEEYFNSILQLVPGEKREQVAESLQLLSNILKENKCCDLKGV